MVFLSYRSPRILVLGLGDPSKGDAGIGIRLARSLRDAFEDVDVSEMVEGGQSFLEVLHDYDVLIVLTAITYCSVVGRVYFGGPYSLSSVLGEPNPHAQALQEALSYARLTGQRVPRVEVIGVCVTETEAPGEALSAELEPKYAAILASVRSGARRIIKDARSSVATPPSRA